MKFLEKELICIDLDGIDSIDKFRILSKKIENYGIIIENSIWSLKNEINMTKLFIHKKTLEIVFIEILIDKEKHIGLYPFMSDKLKSMNSTNIKKKMDMDSILERVYKNGIKSLTKKEEKVLKSIKK